MGVVTLQLGQCGNQLGAELFSQLARYPAAAQPGEQPPQQQQLPPRFFRGGEGRGAGGRVGDATAGAEEVHARAVLVDMEPKVIWKVTSGAEQAAAPWRYDRRSQYTQAGGSGNNWAYGYGSRGASAEQEVLELVRQEAERCDRLEGLMLLQSLAGGTGSGVGAYLTESLREQFPSTALINHVVWPYESGEVIVQHYNCLLTLATVAEAADAVIYFENEQADRQCRQMLGLPKPSFDDINRVMAGQLAQFYVPASLSTATPLEGEGGGGGGGDGGGGGGRVFSPAVDIVRHCCCNPRYRLLTARTLPQLPAAAVEFEARARWQPLLQNLRQMVLADAAVDERANWRCKLPDTSPMAAGGGAAGGARSNVQALNRSCASLVVIRGDLNPDPPPVQHGSPAARRTGSSGSAHGGGGGGGGGGVAEAWGVFGAAGVHTPWADAGEPLAVAYSPTTTANHWRSAAVLSNSQSLVRPLDRVVGASARMLEVGAYLHHYERHGVGRDTFSEHLATAEQILFDYRSL
eukprot:COSAG01_NODE_1852_length_9061_cov_50.987949_3_plen_520_part_00